MKNVFSHINISMDNVNVARQLVRDPLVYNMSTKDVIRKSGMILRNHIYLKVYKCWRVLPILKTPTQKMIGDIFQKIF